jgi:hypothetical protein
MKNTDSNEKAVARLRASKEQGLKELRQQGKDAGIDFALNDAEYLDLERLAGWRDKNGDIFPQVLSQTSFKEIAALMADEMEPEGDPADWARERWGDDINQTAWVEAFVSAALAKYQELKGKL